MLFQFEAAPRGARAGSYCEAAPLAGSPNLVVINVSPIEYGHVLLVPAVRSLLPQQVGPDTLTLALHFAAECANPYFRVGFNSLGAYATINHLHFQAYFLQQPFPIERAPTMPLAPPPGAAAGGRRCACADIAISRLVHFPVRALVFEVGRSLADLGAVVGAAAQALQRAECPFNLLITDCGARVFLVPNRFSSKAAAGTLAAATLETGINPAVFEIAGHLLYKRQEDYDAATQDSAWALLAEASLSEADFNSLVDRILPLLPPDSCGAER